MQDRGIRQAKSGGDSVKNLQKCERCPAMIRMNAKRCGPCQDDVRREAHRMHEKRRHEKRKMERLAIAA